MMKKYDSYKHSGVEWIGDIPKHWVVKRLKYLGESIIGVTYSPNDVTDENNGILVLRSSNIQNGKLAYHDCVYIKKEIPEKLITKVGDVLICARNGSAELVGKNACIDQKSAGYTFGAFMAILRAKDYRFLSYFLNSSIFKAQLGSFSTSTINQLTNSTLNNFEVAIPLEDDEQAAIANFLDDKTSQIDSLIQKKQRMIALLEEEKTAVINEAVTKGLNPDAPMKNSGVQWLGRVPAHWKVMKLKHVANLRSGDSITSDSIDKEGEYPVYGGNGLRGYTSSFTHEGYYSLIGRQGALCGNVNYANGKFWASEHAIVVSIKGSHDTFWLGELLRAMSLNQYSVAAAQPGLSVDNIQNLYIPVPPQEEQYVISVHIRNELSRIASTTLHIEKEIELMQEYRTALISEAVTGKIDVRDYQPEPITSTALA